VEKLGETAKNAGPLDKKTAHLVQLAAAVANNNDIGFPTVMAGVSWAEDVM